MTVQANASGVVTGKFTIPAGIPAGTKNVEFTGGGGTHGSAAFIGQGHLQIDERQMVTTINGFYQAVRRVDPLAQTFTLDTDQQIRGVDLWFAAKGTSDVLVEIRETSVGFPTQTIVASSRVSPSEIAVNGSSTRFNFAAPVSLLSGTEYAIVVLCNDAVSACSIAELGKWDSAGGKWVTSQPYQVGVLLTSSNASTWSASQDKDLAFRLIQAKFTETSKTVVLGSIAVANATDLMVKATIGNPSSNTGCEFLLEFPDKSTLLVSADQPVRLNTPVTGNVKLSAVLRGNFNESPVLYADVQLLHGTVAESANYVSRAISGGTGVTVKVIVDAYLPGSSSMAVKVKGVDSGDTWTTINSIGSVQLGDGWVELTYQSGAITEQMVHSQLVLNGNSQYRPQVKNLRMLVV